MASRNASTRREPSFGSGPPVHVEPADRPPAKSKTRNPRRKSSRKKGSRKRRGSLIVRAAYWSLVVMLWAGIGGVGAIVWVGAHLPPIQSLEIPKRPPSISILDQNMRPL